ncbi:NAD-dependent epimerase/dehydratase family protein [Streptomyces qinzhouensis]|uniref:Reductase n=1 Tax=Streptomyces qinzhouensis TaxID=2599401 RepID=A0A5B8JJS3_9ACTN|nr:NAD-dependent epimerase/dehydratase family protein [Streptomyces qinzhouensis]QDY80111.1 reductase [Streptomyces qinzhouensis]
MQRICVIGGSRYFGRLLVRRLQAAGHRVTLVNRGSAPPPPGVDHVIADRNDPDGLRAALGTRTFDAVADQFCYSPLQAADAVRVFRGRTRRYVMTSTIEVYNPATAVLPAVPRDTLLSEGNVSPAGWLVSPELPWRDQEFLDAHYSEGKRQAEAVFTREAAFEFATVRVAHVLGGGAQDFTGRLAHYTERIVSGQEIVIHERALPSVFVHHEEMADCLLWAATATDFTGPLNACSDGPLDVHALTAAITARTGRSPRFRTVAEGEEASPYSFDRHYAMSNTRAADLGFRFSHVRDWLPSAVDEALGASALPTV